MLRFIRVFIGALFITSLLVGVSIQAQEPPPPLVAFVVDAALQSASPLDNTAQGVSRLADKFQALGAEVDVIDLNERLPEEIDVIVMVGPQGDLTEVATARLWERISQGANLLLAVDPLVYQDVKTVSSDSGLATLLYSDYGILLHDTFLVEPWFTQESIKSLTTVYTRTYPDVVQNPVTAPLNIYDDLPVQVWGARSMEVEALGMNSVAAPLLYNETAYGETNDRSIVDYVFNERRGVRVEREQDPFDINIGTDFFGRLNVGAMAENFKLESRIVVLGDSEMLRNAYGLGTITRDRPVHIGNQMLADNIVAWLLEQPMADWPLLPPGYTWIAIDGNPIDWVDELETLVIDAASNPMFLSNGIENVVAYANASYLYLLVETTRTFDEPYLTIGFNTADDGMTARTRIVAGTEEITALLADGSSVPVPDGHMAADQVIELRLPLRLIQDAVAISQLHLSTIRPDLSTTLDLLEGPVLVPVTAELDPAAVRMPPGLLGTIDLEGQGSYANLRAGPSLEDPVVNTVIDGALVSVLGKDESEQWYQIQNARLSGWIAGNLVLLNGAFPTPSPTPDTAPYDAVVNDKFQVISLWSGPSFDNYAVWGTAEPGDKVVFTARNVRGDWVQVVTREGLTAWAPLNLLDVKEDVDVTALPVLTDLPTPTPTLTPIPATPVPRPAPSAGEPFDAWWVITGVREDLAANTAYHTVAITTYGGSGFYEFYLNGEQLPSNVFEFPAPLCAPLVSMEVETRDTEGNSETLNIMFKSFCPTPLGCTDCELWQP